MAVYTAIDDPEAYFQTVIYTGNDTNRTITLDADTDMQPDLVWMKDRDQAIYHRLTDSVRGVGKVLFTNVTNAEQDDEYGTVGSFVSDGFTIRVGANANSTWVGANENTVKYVAWCWKAGGSASTNENGSIDSSVSANTDAGFSIVSFTGTGSVVTIGHGLGTTPAMIILKNRTVAGDYWHAFHQSLGGTKVLYLNATSATATTSASWNDTNPTSTVFTNGSSTYTDSSNYIAYCFAEKQGFSKFGKYTGNGNANGTFIYTGFRPAFVMIKRTDSAASWVMHDTKRATYNPAYKRLHAELADAEYTTSYGIDILSNGFKPIVTDAVWNASGGTYIYMAFAEAPFVNSNGVPCNAR